jgi:hypothetical protein
MTLRTSNFNGTGLVWWLETVELVQMASRARDLEVMKNR